MAEDISKIREKPGESNAGKYYGVKKSNFAGPDGTYPINTEKRAKALFLTLIMQPIHQPSKKKSTINTQH